MDIDLLSKMVKELILDEDRVVLPGLGCFVAEIVPAYFSDKGYTINPPYRKLYFRARPDDGDALIEFYAKSNKLDYEIAEKVIKDFVAELKSVLHVKKLVVFPGLGRLRATKENNIFFIADEDLDIYPEGFGLESISLKTHHESREEVAAVVATLKNVLSDTLSENEQVPQQTSDPEQSLDPVAEPTPEQSPDPVTEPTPEQSPELLAESTPEQSSDPVTESTPEPAPDTVAEDVPESLPTEESKAEQTLELLQTVETETESVIVPEQKRRKKISWGKMLLVLLIAFVILVVAYMTVGRLCPEWIDQFLYTPEELEILNR